MKAAVVMFTATHMVCVPAGVAAAVAFFQPLMFTKRRGSPGSAVNLILLPLCTHCSGNVFTNFLGGTFSLRVGWI